jgi:hypothetical protein
MTEPDGSQRAREAARLDYASPGTVREAPPSQQVAKTVLGFLIAFVVMVGMVFAGWVASDRTNSVAVWWLVALVTAVGINVCAVIALRHPRQRGWAIGLWLGFGAAVLVEGICFMRFM